MEKKELIINWEQETDVLVAGFGGAGACAAIAAHDAGARVLLIEKAPFPGGNSACALGPMRLPGSVEEGVKYYRALSFGTVPDEGLIRTMAEALHSLPQKLTALGIRLKRTEEGVPMFPTLPGAKCMDHWTAGCGYDVFQILARNVEARGIPVRYESRARKLVQDPFSGEIQGVIIESKGKEEAIRADRAVILSTGGYENDPELQACYHFPGIRLYPYGTPYNTGDGVRMAAAAGAAPWHFVNIAFMGLAFKGPSDEHGVAFPFLRTRGGFIFVNKQGKRFMNDARRINFRKDPLALTAFDHEKACYPNLPAFLIFDENQRTKGPLYRLTGSKVGYASWQGLDPWSRDNSEEIKKGWILQGETIEALAERAGIEADNLAETITLYNRHCSDNTSDTFGRSPETMAPIAQPPFYAAELCLAIVNTQGGPKHNHLAQTLDMEGNPIPRLYTPGELGSFFGHLYQGGSNLPEALAFGLIAGECAAKEKTR
ncbi:MAG: FAD-dependent oxidoreductase [Thermodesulfobacteriota bacterium]